MQGTPVRSGTSSGFARWAGLGLLVIVAAACGQKPAPPRQPETRPVPRLLVFSPAPPQRGAPAPAPAETPAVPTAAYSSLRSACDAVHQLMAARLAVPIARADSVTFENEFVAARRTGCELKAAGTFDQARPDSAGSHSSDGDLTDALTAAGWAYVPRYSADGPDGSISGVRSRETLCIFNWRWDGGDDGDSTYVPSNEWELVTHCAVQEPGDSV
jgi:hypothetical protein